MPTYNMLMTSTQALQLVALVPSIFIIAFLLYVAKRDGKNIVPALYFLSLICQFAIPLVPLWSNGSASEVVHGLLMLGGSLIPALSFLLIIQFITGRIPAVWYWLVLILPIIGGSPFIYASMQASEICLGGDRCVKTDDLRVLYEIASAALIFLLIMIYTARSHTVISEDDQDRIHKYWLIIALIILNVAIVAISLMTLAEVITPMEGTFVATIIRIGFIYLVLTSIFRLFYDLFEVTIPSGGSTSQSAQSKEADKKLIEELDDVIEFQHIYREMGLSRKQLAERLDTTEHQLSRVINTHYNKSFHELMNQHRVEDAKHRLRHEQTQITTIAFDVGFNSIASFNRVFKELVGRSPTEYRNFKRVT